MRFSPFKNKSYLEQHKKDKLIKVLTEALKETYQSEMKDTQMEHMEVGEGKTYADKQDWAESKLHEWRL